MRPLLILFFFIMTNIPLWSSTIFVGVDSKKIVIWEYWKVENGIPQHETLIYNPTDEVINIEFKKYHYKKQSWIKRLFSRNSLFKIKALQPGDYILYKDFNSKLRGYVNVIEVHINKNYIGLYSMSYADIVPISKIQEGIIINRQMNNGRNLSYETVYDQLVINEESEINAEMKYYEPIMQYYEPKMQIAGFPIQGLDIKDSVNVELIEIKNLNIEKDINFKLKYSTIGKVGEVKLKFTNLQSKVRFAQTTSYIFTIHSAEGIQKFYIPLRFDFSDKEKYG